jgi:hypothetical protein
MSHDDVNYEKEKLHKLNDLFTNFDKLAKDVIEKNSFKVQFYVSRIEPDS